MTRLNTCFVLVLCLLPGVFALTRTAFDNSFEVGLSEWTNSCKHYGYVTGNTYAWIEDQFVVASPTLEGSKSLYVPDRFVNKKYHLGQLSGHQTATLWKVPVSVRKEFISVDVGSIPVTMTASIYDTMESRDSVATVGLNSLWVCNDYGTGDSLKTECSASSGVVSAGIDNNLAQYTVFGTLTGQRSLGWHTITFAFDGNGNLLASFDGVVAYDGVTPIQTLSSVGLSAKGAGVYFDAVSVIIRNRIPVVVQPARVVVRAGTLATVQVLASDADNDALTVTYDSPLAVDGTWLTSKSDIGTHTIGIAVTDGEDTAFTTVEVEVIPNKPPTISSLEDVSVAAGDVVTLAPVVSDPEDDLLFVTYGAPMGADGVWQTEANDVGVYVVNVTVSDGEFEASTLVTITVKPKTYTITFDDGFLVNDALPTFSECIREVKKNKIINACSSIANEFAKLSSLNVKGERARKQLEAATQRFSSAFVSIGCDDILSKYSSSDDMLRTWITFEKKILEKEGMVCVNKKLTYDGVTAFLAKRHGFDVFSVRTVDGIVVQENTFTVQKNKMVSSMTIRYGDVVTKAIYHTKVKRTKIIESGDETWMKGGYHLEMVIENGVPHAAVVAD